MRILIGSNTPNDLRLAVARVMHFIGEGWRQMGHQVDYLYASDVPKLIPRGRLPWINYALAAALVLRSRERQGIHYDVLNFHGGDGCFVGLYDWLRRRERRLVVTMHGVEEMYWQVQNQESKRGLSPRCSLKELFARYALRRSQALLAVRLARCVTAYSEAGRDFMARHYRVLPQKIVVVANGVPAEYLAAQREYSHPASRLLFVGTWGWYKGKRYLVEAAERLVSSDPTLTFSLVGTGKDEATVKADFPVYVRPHVRVIPEAPNELVRAEYLSHDVFVFPSLFEGSSLALLEAMASGMPVVVSDAAGAARDIIQSGEDGLVVPARDVDRLVEAIRQLLGDVELRRYLGTNARRKMRELTWDQVARRWMEAIQSCQET